MIITISAGHTPLNPGVKTGVISEYSLSSEIIGRITNILSKSGHEIWIIGADSNRKQIERINAINPACGLEIHFNGHKNIDINGTETLHAGTKNGILLAKCVQNELVIALKTNDRGIKKGHYRGDKRKSLVDMLRYTNCPFIIPEPLFLSSPNDLSFIDCELIANAISRGLLKYANK